MAGCQLPLFWDLERMPWKGGGVVSIGHQEAFLPLGRG